MKIIRIKNCLNCPLSELYGLNTVICESSANFNHADEIINVDNGIPKWCPLEEESE